MHTINSFLYKVLLLLFLGTSYLSAIHIHQDEHELESACEVCVVTNSFKSLDIPNAIIDIASFKQNHFYKLLHKSFHIVYINKGYCSTAPPLYS